MKCIFSFIVFILVTHNDFISSSRKKALFISRRIEKKKIPGINIYTILDDEFSNEELTDASADFEEDFNAYEDDINYSAYYSRGLESNYYSNPYVGKPLLYNPALFGSTPTSNYYDKYENLNNSNLSVMLYPYANMHRSNYPYDNNKKPKRNSQQTNPFISMPYISNDIINDRSSNEGGKTKITTAAYGSIHDTAYYFSDFYIGSGAGQRQSLILDTGSSVMGFACTGCRNCGEHIDEKYSCSNSDTCELLECSDRCRYCDISKSRCAYKVSYMEGSSLQGFWNEDYIRIEPVILDDFEYDNNLDLLKYKGAPMNERDEHLELSDPIKSAFGCHVEETHLFLKQKASGILGLETVSSTSPDPFMKNALIDVNCEQNTSQNGNDFLSQDGNSVEKCSKMFVKSQFALCLSANGGVLTVGGTNEEFHVDNNRKLNSSNSRNDKRSANNHKFSTRRNTDYKSFPMSNISGRYMDDIGSEDYIQWTPIETASGGYTVYLSGISVEGTTIFPFPNSSRYSLFQDNNMMTISHQKRNSLLALIDSGTTLTYLPSVIYSEIVASITRYLNKSTRQLRQLRVHSEIEPISGSVITNPLALDSDVPEHSIQSSAPFRRFLYELSESKNEYSTHNKKVSNIFDSHKRDEILEVDSYRSSAPRRRAKAMKMNSALDEDCWYMTTENDIKEFPNITLTFLKYNKKGSGRTIFENIDVTWKPTAYLYEKGSNKYRCLGFAADTTSGGAQLPPMTVQETYEAFLNPHIVLGSSFFIEHDVIFDVTPENERIGFAAARCPSVDIDARDSDHA